MNGLSEHLRHRRLVHAANAAAIAAHPNVLQLQRLAELWLSAGQAVSKERDAEH